MAWIGAAIDATAALVENDQAKSAARKNREFQERLSSSAYQRQTEDLRLAGLNRALGMAKGSGSGSSTPAGATAKVPSLSKVGSTALQSIRLKQELANMKTVEAKDYSAMRLMDSQRMKVFQEERNLKIDEKILGQEFNIRVPDVIGAGTQSDIESSAYGVGARYLERGTRALKGIAPNVIYNRKRSKKK